MTLGTRLPDSSRSFSLAHEYPNEHTPCRERPLLGGHFRISSARFWPHAAARRGISGVGPRRARVTVRFAAADPHAWNEREAFRNSDYSGGKMESTLRYLGVNLGPTAPFPLEHDEKDTAVCHIDHLRCHRVRAVSSALGAHPKALQRDDGRYPSPFDEDGAHADVADGRCGARR